MSCETILFLIQIKKVVKSGKNHTLDSDDTPMEGLTLPGEQKGYVIGRVLVRVVVVGDGGRVTEPGLSCKMTLFLIQIKYLQKKKKNLE